MAETHHARKSREYRERHPERVRAANLARNDYKREWEAGECPQCGGRLASGKRAELCLPCRSDEYERAFKAKARRFIKLRKEGLLNNEIKEREGLPYNTVAQHLYLAKRDYGMDVPRSPYFKAPA